LPVLTSSSTKFDQVVQSPHGPRSAALITFAGEPYVVSL
jgi:hypothetical protein